MRVKCQDGKMRTAIHVKLLLTDAEITDLKTVTVQHNAFRDTPVSWREQLALSTYDMIRTYVPEWIKS